MNWLYPLFSLVAQGAPAPGTEGMPHRPDPTLMILVVMFVAFYFLLIAPQRKRQKEMDKMLSNVKKGDRVIFAQGIYGTVRDISEEKADDSNPRAPKAVVLTIEVDKNTKLTVRREAVTHVLSE